jgi:N6-adenosine-specific RNA methylase IME4
MSEGRELVRLPRGREVSIVGWTPDHELTFGEWLEEGRTIGRVQSASLWWLGDWWRYGEHRYGDRVRAIEELGLPWSFQTCMNAGWVAGTFAETSRRREVLSWSHHLEVAPLDEAEQDEWLDAAETSGWSRNELREQLRERRSLDPPPPPEGRYRCILIDPPWPVEKIVRQARIRQGAALDYPTMPLEQIAALPIPKLAAEDGCHVYLWTTHKHLPDALDILDGWGADYECPLTWCKPTGVAPFSWLYDTEHVLFARLGSLPLQQLGLRLWFTTQDAKREHSVKPDAFYERVRAASPEPRLEMFARERREGFHPWGDEVAA